MKKILVILFTLFSINIFAQDLYLPDRPGYTYNAQVIGYKNLDMETGFGYAYQNYNTRTDLCYNTLAFRYGVLKNLEVRGEVDFGNIRVLDGDNSTGIMSGILGIKVPIHINDSIVQIGIVGSCYMPKFGEDYFQYPKSSPQITLALQKNIDKVTFFGNVGGMWNGYSPIVSDVDFQTTASLSVYYFPTNFGMFIETWHRFSKGNPSYNNFDCGAVYIFSDNFMCDLSVGLNYKEFGDNDNFVNFGLAWRILNGK